MLTATPQQVRDARLSILDNCISTQVDTQAEERVLLHIAVQKDHPHPEALVHYVLNCTDLGICQYIDDTPDGHFDTAQLEVLVDWCLGHKECP